MSPLVAHHFSDTLQAHAVLGKTGGGCKLDAGIRYHSKATLREYIGADGDALSILAGCKRHERKTETTFVSSFGTSMTGFNRFSTRNHMHMFELSLPTPSLAVKKGRSAGWVRYAAIRYHSKATLREDIGADCDALSILAGCKRHERKTETTFVSSFGTSMTGFNRFSTRNHMHMFELSLPTPSLAVKKGRSAGWVRYAAIRYHSKATLREDIGADCDALSILAGCKRHERKTETTFVSSFGTSMTGFNRFSTRNHMHMFELSLPTPSLAVKKGRSAAGSDIEE